MYEVVALTCIVIFFQILMYKIGFMQGEQSAYKRFTKTCNVCRNKNELVGKIDKFNYCILCNSSGKSNSWGLI